MMLISSLRPMHQGQVLVQHYLNLQYYFKQSDNTLQPIVFAIRTLQPHDRNHGISEFEGLEMGCHSWWFTTMHSKILQKCWRKNLLKGQIFLKYYKSLRARQHVPMNLYTHFKEALYYWMKKANYQKVVSSSYIIKVNKEVTRWRTS